MRSTCAGFRHLRRTIAEQFRRRDVGCRPIDSAPVPRERVVGLGERLAAIKQLGETDGWSWREFWIKARRMSPLSCGLGERSLGEVFSTGIGSAARMMELVTGGKCFWDTTEKMWVCWGGKMLAGRGGTTFGVTFVARARNRQGEVVDPHLVVSDYRSLMEHEGNHRLQYETLGPLMLAYFVFEVVAKVRRAKPGCSNPFEWSADLGKGGYRC